MFIPAIILGGLLLMAGGAGKKRRRTAPAPTPTPPREPTPEEAEAITYCEMQGGTTSIMETTEGDSYFVCSFPNGMMVEAGAYQRGEAFPECPIDMMFDPETETCVPKEVIGEAWPPEPDDPNFQICMGVLLDAWAPFTDAYYNLSPAVAQNTYLIMLNAVEESWAGYETPEALADFGMVHVAPECDLYALRAYIQQYTQEVGMPPGTPDDMLRVDQVYQSVVELAKHAMADAEVEPDVGLQEGESQHGLNQGLNPDQGGVFPKCPPNYFYDALHDVCCPDGFYWSVKDQTCRPMGYGGLNNIAAIRSQATAGGFMGGAYAGGCGGRRGHCGVRPRS